MMKIKLLKISLILLLALVEGIFIYLIANDYVFLNSMTAFFYPVFLVIILILASLISINEPKKKVSFNSVFIVCLVLLVANPIFFNIIKPAYTFEDAEKKIEKNEDVKLIKNKQDQFLINSSTNKYKQVYLVTALRGEDTIYYSVDPNTGETYFLNRSIDNN